MQKLDETSVNVYGEKANLLMRHTYNILDQLVE